MITLAELKLGARQRADMEQSNVVEDAELTQYINQSISFLHDLMLTAYGDEYAIASYQFTTTAGQSDYDLPMGFYKLKGVDVSFRAGTYKTLEPFNFNERNRMQNTPFNYGNARYRILGNKLVFSPVPDKSAPVQVWYTPVSTMLVDDADVLTDLNQFSELVMVDAAIKMLVKQEYDPSALMAQKNELVQRITIMAQNRDIGSPMTVTDVYASNNWPSEDWE